MAYTTVDTKTGSVAMAVSTAVSGILTITKLPTTAAAGASVVVGATLKNTGTANNNACIIMMIATGADGVIIKSGVSPNMTVLAGATSSEVQLTFTMPSRAVSIVFTGQIDPNFNY